MQEKEEQKDFPLLNPQTLISFPIRLNSSEKHCRGKSGKGGGSVNNNIIILWSTHIIFAGYYMVLLPAPKLLV